MGFLDNSGDIIIDAVLTDAGRERLARGDGSFKIVKFALADDEIDYSLYDDTNTSGSAYYDIEILQTPILETPTNNTSNMKSKILTIPRSDLLYLPVIRLNEEEGLSRGAEPIFYVAVDQESEDNLVSDSISGTLFGETLGGQPIVLDQGLDTTEISPETPLQDDLVETQYTIMVDSRLARISSPQNNGSLASISFIDDDGIANYPFSLSTDPGYVSTNQNIGSGGQSISGPRGTRISFKIAASIETNSNDYLFDLLGGTFTLGGDTYKYIDSNIRIEGNTTGYSVDLPVRFVKLT